MMARIRKMLNPTIALKAHGSSANGNVTFIPNIPKNTFGRAIRIVANVKSVIVRFRLLEAIAV